MTNNTDAKVISLTYELRNGHAEGDIIEEVTHDNPAEFLFGAGQLVRQFEDHVMHLQADDTFEFTVPSEEAYGPVDEKAVVKLPKDIFVIDGKLADDLLILGNFVNMQDQNGNPLRGKVMHIEQDVVTMDFNHPLAGIDLHFKGQVIRSRAATAEELAHGHVHTGEHGH